MKTQAAISNELRSDLASEMPIEQAFQKHLIDGSSFFFKERVQRCNQEYELRHELSEALNTSINDIVLVGSAKIGFSVKTESFHPFDYKYSQTGNPQDKSDIDIAVVNKKLFEAITEQIFHTSRHFDLEWRHQYWRLNLFQKTPKDLFPHYVQYLARGWLRPDLMPGPYLAHAPWLEICNTWYRQLDRKVSIGFYSDWSYLKHYQMDNLANIRTKVKKLEI